MRVRAALLTVLAGAALVAVPAGPAAAAPCSSDNGVTVVVDFASLGGGEQSRCTDVDPPSGLAALRDAGFTPTRAAQQPGYFVCRIDGKPASDPCQRTSPASAYWSYWHAKRGGAWTYSDLGAADYDPPAGTVEGWAFGAGKPPSSSPPAAAPGQSSAPPRPSTSPAAGSARHSTAPSADRTFPALAAPSTARSSPAPSPARSPVASAPGSPDQLVASPAVSSPDPRQVPGTVRSRPNKYAGPVVAAVLVLLIVAAGVRRALARRRRES